MGLLLGVGVVAGAVGILTTFLGAILPYAVLAAMLTQEKKD